MTFIKEYFGRQIVPALILEKNLHNHGFLEATQKLCTEVHSIGRRSAIAAEQQFASVVEGVEHSF